MSTFRTSPFFAVLALVGLLLTAVPTVRGGLLNEKVYGNLLRAQVQEIEKALAEPGLTPEAQRILSLELAETKELLSEPTPIRRDVYLSLLHGRNEQLSEKINQASANDRDREAMQRAQTRWLELIQAAKRLTSRGYFVGRTTGRAGAALKQAVDLKPFRGKADRPIYIESDALRTLSDEASAKIRAAAEKGQMIVLLSPTSADLTKFRKLLRVTYDIGNSPGAVFAVRLVKKDYAEFSVSTPVTTRRGMDTVVNALLGWQREDLKKNSLRPKNGEIEQNLINIANSYQDTRFSVDPSGFFGTRTTLYASPCFSESANKYFIYLELEVSYATPTNATFEEMEKGLSLYAIDKNYTRPYGGAVSAKRGWINETNIRATVLGLPNSSFVFQHPEPKLNARPDINYKYNFSYGLTGSVSFFDKSASVSAAVNSGYEKTVSINIPGGILIDQYSDPLEPGEPRWKYRMLEQERIPSSSFPAPPTTSSWIWIINAERVPGSKLPLPTSISIFSAIETDFTLKYHYYPGRGFNTLETTAKCRALSYAKPIEIFLPPAVRISKPELTGISVATAAEGTPVTLSGKNLKGVTEVSFGTAKVIASELDVRSDETIELRVPKQEGASKTVPVTAVSLGGFSNPLEFTYPAPN